MSGDEESVEMMEVEEDAAPAPARPRRRMPRRAMSSDQMAAPRKRTPGRAKSTDGSAPIGSGMAPLKRTQTEGSGRTGRLAKPSAGSADDMTDTTMDMSSSTSPAGTRRARRVPARAKTSDGMSMSGRMLPSRTKSGTIGPTRSGPKRTASGFGGRATPRRTKSSDGTANSFAGMRRGRKKEKAGSSDDAMNIFGSDMVSAEKILEDINEAITNPNICRLELEDFFTAERQNAEQIPLALKELLECDDRPWESVHFTDDIMDGSIYEDFRDRKKHFLRTMAGVCEARLIPVSYKAKITLSSGSLDMDSMCDMLFYLRGDKSITELTLKSEQVDESIIRALTELFKADKRKWNSVTLQLSGTGPGKPGSAEHNAWAKEMQAATEDMQKVCKVRGINLG